MKLQRQASQQLAEEQAAAAAAAADGDADGAAAAAATAAAAAAADDANKDIEEKVDPGSGHVYFFNPTNGQVQSPGRPPGRTSKSS